MNFDVKPHILSFAAMILILMVSLTSCSNSNAPVTVAELLDLGEKYLLDLDYEQALVQFLAVIDIEPMNPRAYTGAAEAYVGQDKFEDAANILLKGLEQLPESTEISDMLRKLRSRDTDVRVDKMPEIEFSIDGIYLGETDLSAAKSLYSSRADYKSNLMGQNEEHNTEDTVYSMPYMDDDDPDNDMFFGYLFGQPVGSSAITHMYTLDETLLCLGKYRVGDEGRQLLLDLCELEDVTILPNENNVIYHDGSSGLFINKFSDDMYGLKAFSGEKSVQVGVNEGKIYSFTFTLEKPS